MKEETKKEKDMGSRIQDPMEQRGRGETQILGSCTVGPGRSQHGLLQEGLLGRKLGDRFQDEWWIVLRDCWTAGELRDGYEESY